MMKELTKTTPVDRPIITKDNYQQGCLLVWHTRNIKKQILLSYWFKEFKNVVGAFGIAIFPVSFEDYIRHTIIKRVREKGSANYSEIINDVFDNLYKGNIPYLLFGDYDTYHMFNYVMIYEMVISNGNDSFERDIFPIIDKCLRIPSSEKSVNELIGEVYGRGNIIDDKYTLKLWNAYCKYREDVSKEDDDND